MNNTFIFGHKNPDTDSVCSAISLSYLKNKLGFNTKPVILDEINNETNFVLDKFNIEKPMILNDTYLRIRNVNYKKNISINQYASILDVYKMMTEESLTAIPLVNENNKFSGLISMKDIAKINLSFDINEINTSYENIRMAVSGHELLKFDDEITGLISLPSYKSTTYIENAKIDSNTVLIVGDRHSVIEYAINCGVKLIILTGDSHLKEDHLQLAKKNKVNIIKTEMITYKVARIINFSNYAKNGMVSGEVEVVNENEILNTFKKKTKKLSFSNYPVINDKDECLGLLRLSDLSSVNQEKVILVDHNELSQSIDGIEEANIVEVVDHHKIGDIASKIPINFRNMTVGSTCTIIYLLYKESNIEIPTSIQGLLMSGIISDTVLLNSPTTTKIDEEVLLTIANNLDIDYNIYGKEMFEKGSYLGDMTTEQVIYNDFKKFMFNDYKLGIGQILVTSTNNVKYEDYIILLNKIKEKNNYDSVLFFMTDIINKGSYVLYSDGSKDMLEEAFEIDITEGVFLKDVLSRKNQVVPKIMHAIEKQLN